MFVNCILFIMFVLINLCCIFFIVCYIHFLKVTDESEIDERRWAKFSLLFVLAIFVWNLYDSCPTKKISAFEVNNKQVVIETLAWNPQIVCPVERMVRDEIKFGKTIDQAVVDVTNKLNENHWAENSLVLYSDIIWIGPLESYKGRM